MSDCTDPIKGSERRGVPSWLLGTVYHGHGYKHPTNHGQAAMRPRGEKPLIASLGGGRFCQRIRSFSFLFFIRSFCLSIQVSAWDGWGGKSSKSALWVQHSLGLQDRFGHWPGISTSLGAPPPPPARHALTDGPMADLVLIEEGQVHVDIPHRPVMPLKLYHCLLHSVWPGGAQANGSTP